MAKNKTEINIHARKYIAAVFENRLREEGFSCPNEKLLCWYRIRKGELLDTVIFCSNWFFLKTKVVKKRDNMIAYKKICINLSSIEF